MEKKELLKEGWRTRFTEFVPVVTVEICVHVGLFELYH
jgi:hypothetical protein